MDTLLVKKINLGKSVFANKPFKKGEEIVEFKGELCKFDDFPEDYDDIEDYYVQITEDAYMGPSGGTDDFFNHSCDPNSGLKIGKERVVLIAIKDIKKGEEITWDYSTTMDEDDFEMDCKCESKKCRKIIGDFKYLSKEIQEYYINLGVVPEYILRKIKL